MRPKASGAHGPTMSLPSTHDYVMRSNVPNMKSLNRIPEALQYAEFKQNKQFGVSKNVLIPGIGETGTAIEYKAATSGSKSVTLCYRDHFHVSFGTYEGVWSSTDSLMCLWISFELRLSNIIIGIAYSDHLN
jgi:hypothetical protein